MISPVYIAGWINCPLCGANIECMKRQKGDVPLPGQIVCRPLNCPKCKEKYEISNAYNFYARFCSVCPEGTLISMGEVAV